MSFGIIAAKTVVVGATVTLSASSGEPLAFGFSAASIYLILVSDLLELKQCASSKPTKNSTT